MLSGIIIGTIVGIGFFTYKPLFSTLKKHKFSFSAAYKDYKENEETKQVFKDFASVQMNKVQKLTSFINNKAQSKFGSNTNANANVSPNEPNTPNPQALQAQVPQEMAYKQEPQQTDNADSAPTPAEAAQTAEATTEAAPAEAQATQPTQTEQEQTQEAKQDK